eukprot:698094-Hanusia_phi.AAC.1
MVLEPRESSWLSLTCYPPCSNFLSSPSSQAFCPPGGGADDYCAGCPRSTTRSLSRTGATTNSCSAPVLIPNWGEGNHEATGGLIVKGRVKREAMKRRPKKECEGTGKPYSAFDQVEGKEQDQE